jgi:arginase
MTRTLAIIGAPSSAGAYAPGQEKAPTAFRSHGLVEALRARGRCVVDRGDVAGFRWRPDPALPKCANLSAVRAAAKAVAEATSDAIAGDHDVLVLGGDCTLELGTVAGATFDGARVGVIYIDLDVDLNAPDTSDGALDWTGVAHMLDIPGSVDDLSGLTGRRPLLPPSAVLFFAADNISPPERETMHRLNLECIGLSQVRADPVAAASRALAWAQAFDRLLVHLDVDVLEYVDFPIAENVRRAPGLKFDELSIVLPLLLGAPHFRALTITEVNPEHAPDSAEIFAALNGLLSKSFGESAPAAEI